MAATKSVVKNWLEERRLPDLAKAVRDNDRSGALNADPGPQRVIDEGIAWLGRAQDCSRTNDGGVARHFSLIDGWAPSYPETTGYIVNTMLEHGGEAAERGLRMLDWLVSIQMDGGGFQGGMIGQTPKVPVTFNTGQILMGLAAGAARDPRYLEPMRKAADWLASTQDADGCWRKFSTPFAEYGDKAYETHVSWGLLQADAVDGTRGYKAAALRQVDWALTRQAPNGWLFDCCLSDVDNPLTHTLGYALRGIVEAWLYSGEGRYREAACKLADGLMSALKPNGYLPGRLNRNWEAAVDSCCVTGASQIAHSWLLLFGKTGRADYREAALKANAFVRRTIDLDGPPETRGGVKGSYPVDGEYGRWQYLNWACKFTIDSNREELRLNR